MRALRTVALIVLPLLTAACTNAPDGTPVVKPFGYARDRCAGSFNQCSLNCTDIEFGPARAACSQQCLTVEDRCYMTGDEGSALAVQEGVGAAQTQEEKEADFQRWKAKRQRERDAAKAEVPEPQ